MTGSIYAPVVIAIVVSIVLAGWIAAVFHANAHPRHRAKGQLKTTVRGGAFMAEHGGRQLMPIPEDWTQDIPAQRAATGAETYRAPADAGDSAAADLSEAEADTSPLASQRPR